MKKLFLAIGIAATFALVFSSCTTMKRDCNGNKHYKLKNGIYL